MKRPFTHFRQIERVEELAPQIEALRGELALLRSQIEALAGARTEFERQVRAEFGAHARSLQAYRELVESALRTQRPV
jgi:hypothetical protein